MLDTVALRAFVETIESQTRSRQQMLVGQEGGTWVLREEHGSFWAKNKLHQSFIKPPFPPLDLRATYGPPRPGARPCCAYD